MAHQKERSHDRAEDAGMCGRYVRRAGKKGIADWFGIDPDDLPEFGPSFNIAPQTFQPVVRLSPESGEREIVLMRWGLVPSGRGMRETE